MRSCYHCLTWTYLCLLELYFLQNQSKRWMMCPFLSFLLIWYFSLGRCLPQYQPCDSLLEGIEEISISAVQMYLVLPKDTLSWEIISTIQTVSLFTISSLSWISTLSSTWGSIRKSHAKGEWMQRICQCFVEINRFMELCWQWKKFTDNVRICRDYFIFVIFFQCDCWFLKWWDFDFSQGFMKVNVACQYGLFQKLISQNFSIALYFK